MQLEGGGLKPLSSPLGFAPGYAGYVHTHARGRYKRINWADGIAGACTKNICTFNRILKET